MKIIYHKINKHELFWTFKKWNYGINLYYGQTVDVMAFIR